MRIAFIINSRSSASASLVRQIENAQEFYPEFEIEVDLTSSTISAFVIAYKKTNRNWDALIACGGDGTTNEVLNGIMMSENQLKPMLGHCPIGSANDFARSIDTNSPKEIIERIKNGEEKLITFGQLIHKAQTRSFINAATCGIGGMVSRSVNTTKMPVSAKLKYLYFSTIWQLKYKPCRVKVIVDNESRELDILLAVMGNGRYVGYRLGLTPQANPMSPNLALTIVKPIPVLKFARHLPDLRKGSLINDPNITYTEMKHLELEVVSGRLPVETDGEFVNFLDPGDTLVVKSQSNLLRWV